jgi:hypothetical protein
MADDPNKKRVVVALDPGDHDDLVVVAEHYHSSVRGTIARYVREGLEREAELIAAGRDRARRKGARGG